MSLSDLCFKGIALISVKRIDISAAEMEGEKETEFHYNYKAIVVIHGSLD